MKQVNIKVCGLAHTENIHEVAATRPDYMGFIFYAKSPRYAVSLNVGVMKELGSMAITTGVFVDAEIADVVKTAEKYSLRAIQLHGIETPAYCQELRVQLPKIELIKAFGVDSAFNFQRLLAYEDCVDYFLFDTQSAAKGGTGKRFDWSLLLNYADSKPYFLSGGIGPEDVSEIKAIGDPRLYAVDINSRFEVSAGVKDASMAREFIQNIRSVNRLNIK